VSQAVLSGLALLLCLLLGLAGAGALSRGRRRFVPLGTALAAAAGLLLGAAGIAAGSASLALPIGLPGAALSLALDPLAAFFLLPVCLPAIAAGVWVCGGDERGRPCMPLFLAGMMLTVLAGDGWTLLFGFELMSLASWVLLLPHVDQPDVEAAARLYAGMAVLGAACLVPAFALLGGVGAPFAALRATPPEGLRAGLVLALMLIGAGSKAGLAPLHVWLPPAHAAAPAEVSAMMSAGMTKVAVYVLIRVLFDLCGPQPVWWCVPVLLMGAGSALIGALRATREPDLKTILACSTVENIGLIALGLSVALAARGSDLSALAVLGLGAALLHVLMHSGFKSLLFLAAGSAIASAGTRRLEFLGGLAARMKIVTLCVLVAAASWAALPPSAGFASEWLLLQSLLAAPRVGGLALQAIFAVAATIMALSAALAAAAAVRLVGVAFLGRPRSARGSAATEAPAAERAALVGLAAWLGLLGIFPGLAMRLVGAVPAMLIGREAELGATGTRLAPLADAPGYLPLMILLLLGLAGAVLVWRMMGAGVRTAPAWDCGFNAPPPWLPFGDPATQYGGRSFAQPIDRAIGGAILRARELVRPAMPGSHSPARYNEDATDPAERAVFVPIGAARHRVSDIIDQINRQTIRRSLALVVATLVLLLALIALQGIGMVAGP